MLFPETLMSHFHAMASGIAMIFDFDKIDSLEKMSDYMEWVDRFFNEGEYPPDFDTGKLFDYKSKKEALQGYTHLQNFAAQYRPDAKAVLQHFVLMIITSTAGGDITTAGKPEQFALIKDLA